MRSADFFSLHPVFSHEEYLAAHGRGRRRSPRTADSLLTRHASAGRLLHVRRGLYAAVPAGTRAEDFRADPYLLAGKLAPDATVAYHGALQFRGKAFSQWHRFAVLSHTQFRTFRFQDNEFVRVPFPKVLRELPDMGGGVVSQPHAGGTVRVTTLERTLVDVLDAPELGGGWEEIWRSLEMVESFDLDVIVAHALRLASALTMARVGFFLEQHRERLLVEDRHLAPLREHSPSQPRYLDSTRESGRLAKPWNLIVPDRVARRAWQEAASDPGPMPA